MKDEFKKIQEYVPGKENEVFKENQVALENITAPEIVTAEEFKDPETTEVKAEPKFNKSKKDNALSALTGGLTATIAAVVVGITSMLNVNMSAEFESVEYKDANIAYVVNVKDMTEDETLTAYLYEENKLLETLPLTDEDSDGVIEGNIALDSQHIAQLLENNENVSIKYRLDLKGVVGLNVERSFDSYVVRIDKMTSKFEDVDMWCSCGVDGYYNFQMNFTDDYNLFSDFTAYIEDSYGNVSHCTFTENLHEPQKIYVMNLKGATGTITISYSKDGEQERQVITRKVNF